MGCSIAPFEDCEMNTKLQDAEEKGLITVLSLFSFFSSFYYVI